MVRDSGDPLTQRGRRPWCWQHVVHRPRWACAPLSARGGQLIDGAAASRPHVRTQAQVPVREQEKETGKLVPDTGDEASTRHALGCCRVLHVLGLHQVLRRRPQQLRRTCRAPSLTHCLPAGGEGAA